MILPVIALILVAIVVAVALVGYLNLRVSESKLSATGARTIPKWWFAFTRSPMKVFVYTARHGPAAYFAATFDDDGDNYGSFFGDTTRSVDSFDRGHSWARREIVSRKKTAGTGYLRFLLAAMMFALTALLACLHAAALTIAFVLAVVLYAGLVLTRFTMAVSYGAAYLIITGDLHPAFSFLFRRTDIVTDYTAGATYSARPNELRRSSSMTWKTRGRGFTLSTIRSPQLSSPLLA